MNNLAPDLSGLVPYIIAFIAVAVVVALVVLVIISQEVASFISSHSRPRVERRRTTVWRGPRTRRPPVGRAPVR